MAQKLTMLQDELPHLSTNSQHITVEGATHEGLVSQAKNTSIVTDSHLRVLEMARERTPQRSVRASVERRLPNNQPPRYAFRLPAINLFAS